MDTLPIVLIVCGPVVAIGTAFYVWRQRAPTPGLRRRRALQVAIGLMLAFLAIDGAGERDLHRSQGQLWFDVVGKATLMELDGGLRSLSFLPDFSQVRAIVIGRFARSGGVTRENLAHLLGEIPALRHLPVIANCDFGHTTPVVTLPVGGRCKLVVNQGRMSVTLTAH